MCGNGFVFGLESSAKPGFAFLGREAVACQDLPGFPDEERRRREFGGMAFALENFILGNAVGEAKGLLVSCLDGVFVASIEKRLKGESKNGVSVPSDFAVVVAAVGQGLQKGFLGRCSTLSVAEFWPESVGDGCGFVF